jgi:hypothetical protein
MLTSVRVPVFIDTYSVQAQLEEGTRVRGSETVDGLRQAGQRYRIWKHYSPETESMLWETSYRYNSSRKSSSKIACHVTFVDFGMDSDSRLMRLDLQGEIGKAKRIKRNHYGHNY